MPLATTGEVPPLALLHFELRLGLPEPSTVISRPEMPLSLATKTQTLPSTGLTQTAGCVSTSPPWGTPIFCSSPPVWPGPPRPLRFARLSSRSWASLPLCTARWATLLPGTAGSSAGAVLPRSASLFCSVWNSTGV